MNQYRHLSFPFSSSSFPDFRLTISQFTWEKEIINSSLIPDLPLALNCLPWLSTKTPWHIFLQPPLHVPLGISPAEKVHLERQWNQGSARERGGWEKSQVAIFPQEALVLMRNSMLSPILLTASWHYLGLSNSWEFNFELWHTIYQSPSNSHEATKATCLLQCHCSQCDGERLSDSQKCLSPQISWEPGNRNIPCFASPVLTHCLSFEADLLLPLSTEYLHLVLLHFCSSLMETSLLTLYSVQSGLIPGSLSQESGAETWDTCDFRRHHHCPCFFPTLAPHIWISCLTSPCHFSIVFSIPPFIYLFDFPSGCPHRDLFNRLLVKKTMNGRTQTSESDLQGSVSGLLFSCSQCHFCFALKFWNTLTFAITLIFIKQHHSVLSLMTTSHIFALHSQLFILSSSHQATLHFLSVPALSDSFCFLLLRFAGKILKLFLFCGLCCSAWSDLGSWSHLGVHR